MAAVLASGWPARTAVMIAAVTSQAQLMRLTQSCGHESYIVVLCHRPPTSCPGTSTPNTLRLLLLHNIACCASCTAAGRAHADRAYQRSELRVLQPPGRGPGCVSRRGQVPQGEQPAPDVLFGQLQVPVPLLAMAAAACRGCWSCQMR